MILIGNCFGFIALICAVISFFQKNKEGILLFQTICHIFYVASYFFLDAYTGAFVTTTCLILLICLYFLEKNDKTQSIWLMLTINIVIVIITIVTWSGVICLLTAVANMIYNFSVWQKRRVVFLWCQIFVSTLLTTYNLFYLSYMTAILEFIAIAGAITALTKLHFEFQALKMDKKDFNE